MADKSDKWPENVGGKFFVDEQCIVRIELGCVGRPGVQIFPFSRHPVFDLSVNRAPVYMDEEEQQ